MSKLLLAKKSTELLINTKSLDVLLAKVNELQSLQMLLNEKLQPAAHNHCQIASWKQGHLLLLVTDSYWATRMRYQQKRLMSELKELVEFYSLEKITIRVQLKSFLKQNTHSPRSLSLDAAEHIKNSAKSIKDKNLNEALQRLARHTEKSI